ncbi:ureidoglycolate lyase [bacterium]|nr:ureidoglycolate lyase [bacterium]
MAEIKKNIEKGKIEDTKTQMFQIIKVPEETPLFSNDALDFWSPLGSFPGYTEGYDVGICRIKKPCTYFERMERHLSSCEILIPINGDMFVPLAPPGDIPMTDHIQIVPVKKGELIYLAEGVWHFAAGPLNNKTLDYFVFLKKSTPEKDLEMKDLSDKIIIQK